MKHVPYTFTVLQYHHDTWTGEAMNIGVLLHCADRGYVSLKSRYGRGRLSKAYPDLDHRALRSTVAAMEKRFERLNSLQRDFLSPVDALEYANTVLVRDDSSLSWYKQGSGLTDDPEATHDMLFDRLVTRYEQHSVRSKRSDEMVFEAVKKKLQIAQLYSRFESHTVESKFASVTFEHSFKNGVWHCVQPVSFDSADADWMQEKAARWVGKMQSLLECKSDLKTYFVTGKPQSPDLLPKYSNVLEFLRTSPLDPIVVDEKDADIVVEKIQSASSS